EVAPCRQRVSGRAIPSAGPIPSGDSDASALVHTRPATSSRSVLVLRFSVEGMGKSGGGLRAAAGGVTLHAPRSATRLRPSLRPLSVMLRASFGLRLAGLLLAAGLGVPSAQAQVEDSLAVPPDSLLAELVGLDATAAVGFPRAAPAPPREGGLDHPVAFAARDSLVIVFADTADADGDLGTLFGDARVSYDDAT